MLIIVRKKYRHLHYVVEMMGSHLVTVRTGTFQSGPCIYPQATSSPRPNEV
jgi:hypothetical protein